MKQLFSILLILSISGLVVTNSEREITIFEGQGLRICESTSEPCEAKIQLIDGSEQTYPPPKDCACGVEVPSVPITYDGGNLKFATPYSEVQYQLRVIKKFHTSTSVITIDEGESVFKRCEFPEQYELIQCRTHWNTTDEWMSWCPEKVYTQNETITCRGTIRGSLEEVQTVIEIHVLPKRKVIQPQKVLTCKSQLGEISHCTAVNLLTLAAYNIEDHLVSGELSSGSTNLKNGICELEQKSTPFHGTWRFYMKMESLNTSAYSYGGCIFNPPVSTSQELVVDYEKKLLEPTTLSHPGEALICPIAPYPLTRCYLRSPDNQIILPPQDFFSRTSKVGLCAFPNVDVVHGKWICSVNSVDPHEPDLQHEVFVEPKEMIAMTLTKAVSAITGAPFLELHCQFGMKVTVTNCLFIAPNGRLFHIPSSSYYMYRGKGMDTGHCGIGIDHFPQMIGNWTCHMESSFFHGNRTILVD